MNKSYDAVERFEKAWLEKHPDERGVFCHNVYHIISEDRDGNVTDEKFGINCMTDDGLYKYFRNSTPRPYLYIGTGTAIPPTSSNSMTSPITTSSAIGTGDYLNNVFLNQKYDSTTKVTTARFLATQGYFDYTAFPEDKTITEIGVGNSTNDLLYHARVYDASGEPSSIVKHINERLTIRVYVTTGMKVKKIVEDGWTNNVYKLISLAKLSFPGCGGGNGYVTLRMDAIHNHAAYFASGMKTLRNDTNTVSSGIGTMQETNIGNYLIEDAHKYINTVAITPGGYAGEFIMVSKPRLASPMTLESEHIYTGPLSNDLTHCFGQAYPADGNYTREFYGELPVVDADIQSLYRYSFVDHDWTIQESYVNPTTTQYDSWWLMWSITDTEYFESSSSYREFRVFLNQYTNAPITKIVNRGATFYATDEYWDTSTWVQISDPNNVPVALQGKRYYCTFTLEFPSVGSYDYGDNYSVHTIEVKRDLTVHSITTATSEIYRSYGWSNGRGLPQNRASKMISSDDYEYIAADGWLIYPETNDPNATGGTSATAILPYRYQLYGHDGTSMPVACGIWNTSRGGKVVTTSDANSGFMVYEISQTPSVAPVGTAYPFTTAFSATPAVSSSDNGWIVTSYISGANNQNTTYVLGYDVTGEADTLYSVSSYERAFCIDLTDYMCGHNVTVSDHVQMDIYNLKTKTVVSTFDLPDGYTYAGGCGFDDYVYIRIQDANSAYKTYVYVISLDRLELIDYNFASMSFTSYPFRHFVMAVASPAVGVDSCMVLLGTETDGNQKHYLFKSSDPTRPIRLTTNEDYYGLWWRYNTSCKAQLKYTSDNELVLAMCASRRDDNNITPIAYDIGLICDNGPMSKVPFHSYNRENSNSGNVTCGLYKNYYVIMTPWAYTSPDVCTSFTMRPIERYVPHKMTLETNTINAYNNPVRVSNMRSFTYQVSNDTSIYQP